MSKQSFAENDVLGNSAAHFFKSGNVTRSAANEPLEQLMSLLPEKGNYNTNLEYDLWYTFNDKQIHGYVYTDALTKFIYLKPASARYSINAMQTAVLNEITPEGEMLFNDLATNNNDKYNLKKARKKYDFVIFLPGTNCIDKVIDYDKVENAVKQGAYLKCHPLTQQALLTKLSNRYGKDKIIDKKISGHQLLEDASIVGCGMNSEMGIVATAKGKRVYLFDKIPGTRHWTYTAIYKAINVEQPGSSERLKRLLSCKHSGLVSYLVDNPQERIDHFFTYFKGVKHAKRINTSTKRVS